jgi:hypothetical protein
MEWNSQEEWKEIQEKLSKAVMLLYEVTNQAIKFFKELWNKIKAFTEELCKYYYTYPSNNWLKYHGLPMRRNMKRLLLVRKPRICIRNTC